MISAESLLPVVSLAPMALMLSGCSEDRPHHMKLKCDFYGGVDILDPTKWQTAKAEIEYKLSEEIPVPSGSKPFRTANFTITPLETFDYKDSGPKTDRKSYLVSDDRFGGRDVAFIHSFLEKRAPSRSSPKGLYESCFSIKNWVQEL